MVAEGRKKKSEQIHEVAQGRVWTGSQAKDRGLVDELGGLDRAVEMIRSKAKIDSGKKIALVPYPDRKSFLEVLLERGKETASAEDVAMRKLLPKRSERQWAIGLRESGLKRAMPVLVEAR